MGKAILRSLILLHKCAGVVCNSTSIPMSDDFGQSTKICGDVGYIASKMATTATFKKCSYAEHWNAYSGMRICLSWGQRNWPIVSFYLYGLHMFIKE